MTITKNTNRMREAGGAGVEYLAGTVATGVCVLLFCGLVVGACQGIPSYNRHQKRAWNAQNRDQALKNERNKTQVNDIKIAQTAQLVKVEQQKAQIRLADAVGVRKSQDEISKTLTPLYVQFEAIKAQEKMANGKNHTVVYVPAGPNGVPIVQQATR